MSEVEVASLVAAFKDAGYVDVERSSPDDDWIEAITRWVDVLRSLPVEQRMALMGMVPAGRHGEYWSEA